MQVPSNMFINRISRPSLYIAAAMLLWGLISTLTGNTHNFAGMVSIRFFLGFVEAAFVSKPLQRSVHPLRKIEMRPVVPWLSFEVQKSKKKEYVSDLELS